jgi:hypothetical protein
MLGNENPFANRASAAAWNPVHAAWNTVAHFDDYDSAQRAVDRLSDDGFRRPGRCSGPHGVPCSGSPRTPRPAGGVTSVRSGRSPHPVTT